MSQSAVYVISGASAGIGAACAQRLAAAGAHVVLLARRAAALAAVQATLPQPEEHLSVVCDVTDTSQVQAAIAHAKQHYGRIDGVVCNAGIGLTGPVATMAYHDLIRCMDVNVGGTLALIQACLPIFSEQQRGQIVVISSVVGVQGLPYNGGYCASKGALERLCDALRIELLHTPIRLSVIRPGTVASEFFAQRIGPHGEQRRRTAAGIAPQQVADVVARCLRQPHRIAYTRWQDRLNLWLAQRFPAVSDWVLSRSIRWQQ